MNAPTAPRPRFRPGFSRYMSGALQARTIIRQAAAAGVGRITPFGAKADAGQITADSLQGRFEEILVLVLHQDGSRNYIHVSVRALYKQVMQAITAPHRPSTKVQTIQEEVMDEFSKDQLVVANDHMSNIAEGEGDEDDRDANNQVRPRSPAITSMKPQEESIGEPAKEHREDTTPYSYAQRLGGYLHPRDMRRLVTPFSSSNQPEIIVRRHAILLNVDPLRAIVLRDRLLVVVPEGADSLLMKLERRVRGGAEGIENAIFGDNASEKEPSTHSKTTVLKNSQDSTVEAVTKQRNYTEKATASTDGKTSSGGGSSISDTEGSASPDIMHDEWEEMNAKGWIQLPFELQCVDAVLHVVCGVLFDEVLELQEMALDYIEGLLTGEKSLYSDPLVVIRQFKDSLREMVGRTKGFINSVSRLLDSDEDMALMNLTHLIAQPERFIKPVSPQILEEEADEPELILEAYLQESLTIMNALDLLQGQMDTASDLIDQKLDSLRNRLLLVNMIISVLTLCVTCASVVGAIFGMNLTNYLEDDPNAFRQITFATIGGTLLLMVLITGILMVSGTIPDINFTRAK